MIRGFIAISPRFTKAAVGIAMPALRHYGPRPLQSGFINSRLSRRVNARKTLFRIHRLWRRYAIILSSRNALRPKKDRWLLGDPWTLLVFTLRGKLELRSNFREHD